MTGMILVLLKRHDRIEEVIPYLEEVIKPGMKVLFLLPYPVHLWLYIRDHWVATESSREATSAGRKIMERYSWEMQRALAGQKVSPARDALCKKGVEVVADVYTGPLRRVLRSCAQSRDVHLIMMRKGGNRLLLGLFSRMIRPFSLVKRPSFPPMLLLHPNGEV